MDIHQRLADNINALMKRRQFDDVAALAKAARVAPNTIHSAVKGRFSTSLGSLTKIANALGVDTWQLLAPPAMIDNPPEIEIAALIENFRLADDSGRDTILRVAAAQAAVSTHDLTHQDDL